jgi:hypothetical protein
VTECLDHLVIADGLYLESIDRTFARSIADSASDAGFEGGPLASWFIRSLGPDSTRRFKAPGLFRPSDPGSGAAVDSEIVNRFVQQRRDIMSVIEKCRGVDLEKAKVSSPVSGMLRFRLGDALRLMVEHGKRHLDQADAVLASEGFPSN